MSGILGEIGFVGAVIVSARSGYVLDGHDRIFEALDADNSDVPYLKVDVTEAEESYILATYDPVARLAYHDADLINDLLKDVTTNDESVQALLDALSVEIPTSGSDGDGATSPLTRADVPDAIFPTNNDYEIPLLDIQLQARSFDLPFAVWGSLSRQSKIVGGTYGFYTSDDRFEALWADPSGIVNSGCKNLVEPNFSCYATMPVAVGVYQIYRKRWIARWCQSHDLRVFVDLNVAPKWREINLMGVPRGWSAYMTRSSVDYVDELDEEFALACDRAESSAPLFMVYGGGKVSQQKCKARGWLWIVDQETKKRQTVTELCDGE